MLHNITSSIPFSAPFTLNTLDPEKCYLVFERSILFKFFMLLKWMSLLFTDDVTFEDIITHLIDIYQPVLKPQINNMLMLVQV